MLQRRVALGFGIWSFHLFLRRAEFFTSRSGELHNYRDTSTSGAQTFRFDRKGALAYFVGGDADYPDDSGFALKDWTKCRPEVRAVVASGDMIIGMGNVYFTDSAGKEIYVDKTFGYLRDNQGALRIVLHHSSLPYAAPAKPAK